MRPPLICVWVASQRCDTPGPLWHVSGAWKTTDLLAGGQRVAVLRLPVAHAVAVAAAPHAEVRVVGVVLLHVDDDVLDLREQVDALGLPRVGAVAGAPQRTAAPRTAGPAVAAGQHEPRTDRQPLEDSASRHVLGQGPGR